MIFGSAAFVKKGEDFEVYKSEKGEELGTTVIEDKVGRITGIQKEVNTGSRILKALNKPEEYLQNKNDDLTRINKILTDFYTKEMLRLLKIGHTEEEAGRKATDLIKSEQARYMKQHEIEYPTELTKKTVSKMIKK